MTPALTLVTAEVARGLRLGATEPFDDLAQAAMWEYWAAAFAGVDDPHTASFCLREAEHALTDADTMGDAWEAA